MARHMFLFCSDDSKEMIMHLLRRIERHLIATNTPATRFGRESVRDPRLVHDLRNGREPGQRLIDRVLDHIERRERGTA